MLNMKNKIKSKVDPSTEVEEIKTYTLNAIYVLVMKKNTGIFMIDYINKASRFS